MKKKTNKDFIIINKISEARKQNNQNWMNLLKLAVEVSPKKAKIILAKINKQDKKISKLVEKISKKNN